MGGWMQSRKATFSSGRYKNVAFYRAVPYDFVLYFGSSAERVSHCLCLPIPLCVSNSRGEDGL